MAAKVEEGADADDDRHEGACCRREAHREQGHGVPDRGQVDERDAGCHDGGDVVQERDFGASTGAEVAAEAEVDAREDAVEDIALQVCLACHDDGCIVGEERDDVVGGVLREDGDCDTEADGHRECIAQGLLCAADFARADVLRAEHRDGREH